MIINLLIKYAPDSIINEINALSLTELDKRGLITWASSLQLEPEDEYSVLNLITQFTSVTDMNFIVITKAIAHIYTNYGDCLALKYLMEILAEYFGLLKETENV